MAFTQESIAPAVSDFTQAIANSVLKGKMDRRGHLNGTAKVAGYVCKIHEDDDEVEELRGTVDVQEYNYKAEEHNGQAAGYHEGVLLSAIADNQNGYRIIPCMFSEVIITKDPYTLDEFVIMYSHAKVIEMNAHEQIDINVTEYEDFEETGDEGIAKDYNELEEKGNKTKEKHTFSEITKEVISKDGSNKDEMRADKRTLTVGDTTIMFDGSTINIETSGNVTVKGAKVTITGGQLITQGQASTDMNGPYTPVKVCPFSGVPHCGSMVSGT